MNNNSQNINFKITQLKQRFILSLLFIMYSVFSFAQIKTSIDLDSIKIGEQITYKVEVETDTSALVIFPEGKTFGALEIINSYPIDTTKQKAKYNLIKKYGLTQFDSGAYTIPKQKILINSKSFYTDSLKIKVKEIVVDTTKQGLYDIKPIIKVKKNYSNRWLLILGILLAIALIAFLIWWFIWRKKPLTEAEEIALLPPYDRAKLALQKLDTSGYLQHYKMKEYYSELTFIIRKYLDEKVYDRALESTTDELISRLNLLKEGNQIELSKNDIRNIETILKRADLVKFAKSAPDVELAKIDRNTIDLEIDQVKEALPEPTEEEKLLDQQYKEEQERKQKRKKIVLTAIIAGSLLFITLVGFVYKYGFSYVKDTIIGHESKTLLEGNWVTSDYGYPPITISTPQVLKRIENTNTQPNQLETTIFSYGTLLDRFSVNISTQIFPKEVQQGQTQEQANKPQVDLAQLSELAIKGIEAQGAKNIVATKEKFTTPNGAEGLKTHGTLDIPILGSEKLTEAKFSILQFTAQNVLQQIIITTPQNDSYAKQILDRILNSIELKPKTE